ncbi:P-loop NTPase fold protein [Bdellovibrio bacteriovorus]|uniref:P-loop NTPase fold protein n=1 Tax=Bdellovibrio bacteriovorus TaxID=959 RepID=UPI003A80BB1F
MDKKFLAAFYGAAWSLTIIWLCTAANTLQFALNDSNISLAVLSISILILGLGAKIFAQIKAATQVKIRQFTDLDIFFVSTTATTLVANLHSKLNNYQIPTATIVLASLLYLLSRLYHLTRNGSGETSSNTKNEVFKINHDLLEDLFLKNILENKDALFNLGVSGAWGIGKTHFLKRIYSDLREKHSDQIIPIWIDLWGIKTSDNIVSNYLNCIEKELSMHQIIVPYGELESFAKHMLEKSESLSAASLTSAIVGFKFDQAPKEKIASHIETIEKRLIIFLDNIERVLPAEMPTVLQMVNLFGDIKGIQHVISYDRTQLEKSLSQVASVGDARKYFEKIIEFEVSIPHLTPEFCKDALQSTIDSLVINLNPTHKKKIVKTLDEYTLAKLAAEIKTPRELKRIQIHLRFLFSAVGLNTNIHDLLIITMIKVKHPVIYEHLSNSIKTLVAETRDKDLKSTDQLSLVMNTLGVKPEDQKEIELYVKKLLPKFNSYEIDSTLVSNRRLWHPATYHRYFRFDEISIQLSPMEISDLLEKLNRDPNFIFDEPLWERVNESYTLIFNNLIEMTEVEKNKAASSIIRAIYKRNQNRQSNDEYLNSYSQIEDLLFSIKSNTREALLDELFNTPDSLFWMKARMTATLFTEGSPEQEKKRKTLKDNALTFINNSPNDIANLDYFNLHALFSIAPNEVSPIAQREMELSGTFVFNVLEVAATNKVISDTPSYRFNLDHHIFKIWNHPYFIKLGTEKFSRMQSALTSDQIALWRDYVTATKDIAKL